MRCKTDRKICGTCEHWIGKREPVFDQNSNPKIDILDNYGLCNNPNSRFVDLERRYDLKCVYFSKWTEIL